MPSVSRRTGPQPRNFNGYASGNVNGYLSERTLIK